MSRLVDDLPRRLATCCRSLPLVWSMLPLVPLPDALAQAAPSGLRETLCDEVRARRGRLAGLEVECGYHNSVRGASADTVWAQLVLTDRILRYDTGHAARQPGPADWRNWEQRLVVTQTVDQAFYVTVNRLGYSALDSLGDRLDPRFERDPFLWTGAFWPVDSAWGAPRFEDGPLDLLAALADPRYELLVGGPGLVLERPGRDRLVIDPHRLQVTRRTWWTARGEVVRDLEVGTWQQVCGLWLPRLFRLVGYDLRAGADRERATTDFAVLVTCHGADPRLDVADPARVPGMVHEDLDAQTSQQVGAGGHEFAYRQGRWVRAAVGAGGMGRPPLASANRSSALLAWVGFAVALVLGWSVGSGRGRGGRRPWRRAPGSTDTHVVSTMAAVEASR